MTWGRCVAASMFGVALAAQEPQPTPELRVGAVQGTIVIDGRLDEPDWLAAASTDALRTTEPIEGAQPNGRTEVRVLADAHAVYIGVRCFDPEPGGIVGYAVARDASLSNEDHVKIVLDTFLDGRTGYVFAVNPRGARYDALVADRGEDENTDWDGPWQAKALIDAEGWSVELRLPVIMLRFPAGADVWRCNVERRVQRLLERSRWANANRDQRVTNLGQAGRLVGLPRFDLGLGLAVRPTGVVRFGKESRNSPSDFEAEPSADLAWRITPEWTSVLTLNTDFSETEADTRQINLTRFPLFFPEKRSFFLQGADAFDFGLGLGRDLRAFQSRRIGLVDGRQVPLRAGAKVIGRSGGTSVGALLADTGAEPGVAPGAAMGIVRVRQDVLAQSNVGLIGTFGDPLDRSDSWMLGSDATFQTTELFGDNNFLVGVWGLAMGRQDVDGTAGSYGGKIDYPNDQWDVNLSFKHIDQQFDPSLGFVQRTGIEHWHFGVDHVIRPQNAWLRKQAFESGIDLITELDGQWASWRVFTSLINAEFESGDGIEFNVFGQGERFADGFEIGDGVTIPGGVYEWARYRIKAQAAEKRAIAGELSWSFGDFYDGSLDQWELSLRTVASSWLTVRATADVVRGRLPQGDFAQDVLGLKLSCTFSPDLTLDSFLQFDSDSDSLGTNTRLRWDLTPFSQLFIVGNYNFIDPGGSFTGDGNETTIKIQHELRF